MCRAGASDALRGRGIAKVRASPSRSRPAGMLTTGLGGGHYGYAALKLLATRSLVPLPGS